ncbi:CASP-like protein 4B4 [Carex littledalei]|uniref:CASP-like protein n=1 Tax=Carex littledalei TaxID=544730 RepID=A0A833VNL8_9POAL|nr:CASP-like protein 4B4 [Carex littledalei]
MATPEVPVTTQPVGVADGGSNVGSTGNAIKSTMEKFYRDDTLLGKGIVVLRLLGWLFSLLSLIIMASNKHGDGKNFDQYEEYRYCLAVAILAFLYTMGQTALKFYESHKNKDMLPRKTASLLDFAGDQVIAYLLISGMSAATPLTDYMRKGSDNLFTDSSAASISMAFFAFLAIALSALISGYKLSQQFLD